ncbi:MraY family glycosyltransferase [Prochlorococcus sp. MIT 1011]|uniref:MraY family glycosyltransferase n=1 Tax=Prochlorococcus sp. MIT 1011 TaxID=3082520 RepID=UPI0039B687DD
MFINLLTAILCSWLQLYLMQPLMKKHGLNKPKLNDEKRFNKLTIQNKTLRSGGIAFISSTLIVLLINKTNVNINSFLIIFLCCLPLAFLGLIDDYYHIPKPIRFYFQLITSLTLLIISPLPKTIISLNFIISISLLIFLLISITGIINFINFMDGMDGLVAGCMIIILFSAGIKTSLSSYILVGALIGFLIWNWNPAKIFMGDVGSTFLGAIFCGTILHSNSWNNCFELVLIATPLLADAFLCIPRRYLHGEPIFREPHKLHLYQRLNQAGWSHAKVSSIYIVGTFCLSLAYLIGNSYTLYFIALSELAFGFYLDKYIAIPFAKAISEQSQE